MRIDPVEDPEKVEIGQRRQVDERRTVADDGYLSAAGGRRRAILELPKLLKVLLVQLDDEGDVVSSGQFHELQARQAEQPCSKPGWNLARGKGLRDPLVEQVLGNVEFDFEFHCS